MSDFEFDFDQAEKSLQVREMALKQGAKGLPKAEDTEFDPPQEKLRQHMEFLLEGRRQETLESLNRLSESQLKLETEIESKEFATLTRSAENEVETLKKHRFGALVNAFRKERKLLRELRAFKLRNQVDWEPRYPASMILHWSLIVGAVVAESIANSYFFSKGSELGILGGLFQALLISCVNVGMSALVGDLVLRQFNHILPKYKLMGLIGTCIYTVLLLANNLLAAHFRAQLEIDPERAGVAAVIAFWQNPLNVVAFDAWVMFVFGLVFALAALLKAYTADDRYPGYGSIHRNYEHSLEVISNEQETLIEDITTVYEQKTETLDQLIQDKRRLIRDYRKLLERAYALMEAYDHSLKVYTKGYNALLMYYRKINQEVRQENKVPAYFGAQSTFEHVELRGVDLSKLEKKANQYEESLENIESQRNDTKGKLVEQREGAIKAIEDFFKRVEQEAERLVDTETVQNPVAQ
ncbi:MAG: hypothetical protein A2600_10885 [Candidatus Lambdaproteobacteria bacterium RIFOXYD1_FULL_56_27]|uniref:Uncharacterized protein n=1 Tax=Candidatus Lambdaproteobacteria bacterium RIFOXYD2_FULL_56_26 TaxID=1817773 RepID=A0A1F6H1I1_9PROT|nr:MAG: hypothetical protein A2557_10630 [Candidatus Lambdaproteobacteria bacterium RIFOXYD2_FULL_56_26]OGH05718.1 MAG: hypothetical protein A2426_04300 [Candidatus Lambdaproteobacteria bacterium RIFOXYC1_FULL_56_13]OGH08415.1 MAG: hypothetical protein A2600_10885 [Candidatus Lambdaproteobacteria bacterium RIFOXYD1_FULL_56_27]